jgi:hypothetical protein
VEALDLSIRLLSCFTSSVAFRRAESFLHLDETDEFSENGLLGREQLFNHCHVLEPGDNLLEYDDEVGAYIPLTVEVVCVGGEFKTQCEGFDRHLEIWLLERLDYGLKANIDSALAHTLVSYRNSLICTYHLGIEAIAFEHVMLHDSESLVERFFYFRAFASNEMLGQFFANFSKLCKIQGDPGPRPIRPIFKPFPDQGVFATQWNRVTESFWRGHTEFEWIGRRFLYHCRGMFWACADDYRMPPSEAEREFGSFTGVPGIQVRYFCWELGTEMQRELRMLLVLETIRRAPDDARGPILWPFRLLDVDLARIFGVTLSVTQ